MSKLPVEVLAALSASQMGPPDQSVFNALAHLGSLSNNMTPQLDADHHLDSARFNNNKPGKMTTAGGSGMSKQQQSSSSSKLGTPSGSQKSSQSGLGSSSGLMKKPRHDESAAAFYQGLDMSMNSKQQQRSKSSKSDARARSPLSDD